MTSHLPLRRLPQVRPKMDLELVQVRLHCPVIPALHPAAEAARLHTLDWVMRHGLVRRGDDEGYRRFCELLASALPARCYPEVAVEQVKLASDWIAFLTLYQHSVETAELADPEVLTRLSATEDFIVSHLAGTAPCRHGSREQEGLLEALEDIRGRLAAESASRTWFRRFARHTERFLHGVRWERLLGLDDPLPDVTVCRHLRSAGSAVYTCFDLAALFVPELETSSLEGSAVKMLEETAANYVNWVDDLFHYDREVAEGRKTNLVKIVEHQLGLPFEKARDETIRMCNREIEEFFETVLELEPLGETHPGVRAYAAALEAWMRGNLDAYGISRRYADPRLSGLPSFCDPD